MERAGSREKCLSCCPAFERWSISRRTSAAGKDAGLRADPYLMEVTSGYYSEERPESADSAGAQL